jgi:hypothetical protein
MKRRISLTTQQKRRLADALHGRGGPQAFFSQKDVASFFVLVAVLVGAGLVGLYFGQGGSNAAKLVYYPGLLALAAGGGLLLAGIPRVLGPLPIGRYAFASGVVEVGVVWVYLIDGADITDLQVQHRYARGTRVHLSQALLYVLGKNAGSSPFEMVASGTQSEIDAKKAAWTEARQRLAAARAAGDAETVRSLDPLA